MKKWLKMTIVTDMVLCDAIDDFLIGVIGAAVEMSVDTEPLTMNAFVAQESPAPEEIEKIVHFTKDYLDELAKIFTVDAPLLSWILFDDEDWGKSWKKHFSPFLIIPRLVIAPTWEEYRTDGGEHVIVMDPGMAFGTGHHATTALSLELIEEELSRGEPGKSVLDVGTGTGILGMAAALFGAEKIFAIDNDDDAVAAAGENVMRNSLASRMEVSGISLTEVPGRYSLVVANIIHDVLLQMADDLRRLTADDGKLILSGILAGEQVRNIVSAFEAYGFVAEAERQRGEWAAIRLVRAGEGVTVDREPQAERVDNPDRK